MTIRHFSGPRLVERRAGFCPNCGKRVTRSRTFEQTVNPFNRNPDGSVKSWGEVQEDVYREAAEWVPDFTHCSALSDPKPPEEKR